MGSGQRARLSAFLAKGTNFKGELRFSGVVRIDGIFDGKIFSDGMLVVGQTGVVKGEIRVGVLSVSGLVDGLVEVTGYVEVTGSGRVLGKVLAPSIKVEDGVVLEGECHIGAPAAGTRSVRPGEAQDASCVDHGE